jgi:thioesterase domain-containing protein
MSGAHRSTVEEKRRALLRRRQQEVLARQGQRAGSAKSPWDTASPLVPLRATGTPPPLFLVHAVGGSVAPYVGLTTLLGDDQPVYALEDPGLRGEVAERRLPAIAATYLAAIREVQPDGPLHLGGWSVGGAIALDVARQDGDAAVVFLIDTGLPDGLADPGDDEVRAWFADDLAGMGAELESAELARRLPVFAANVRAFLAHHPSRVDSRVVLLCAADRGPGYVERWRPYTDEVHGVPGDHYTMLQFPHVETLAETLRERLIEVSVR